MGRMPVGKPHMHCVAAVCDAAGAHGAHHMPTEDAGCWPAQARSKQACLLVQWLYAVQCWLARSRRCPHGPASSGPAQRPMLGLQASNLCDMLCSRPVVQRGRACHSSQMARRAVLRTLGPRHSTVPPSDRPRDAPGRLISLMPQGTASSSCWVWQQRHPVGRQQHTACRRFHGHCRQ